MNLEEYQPLAATTAIYPAEYRVTYPTLGLAGEAGEVANKVKKVLRDAKGVLTADARKAIADEVGDVFWYIAALATDLDIKLYDHFLLLPKHLPGMEKVTLYIACIAGKIADCVIMHVDGIGGTAVNVHYYLKELCRMLHALLVWLGVTVEEVLQRNIDKLFSRKERGTLQGDGDNR